MFSPPVGRWVSGLVPQAVDGALDGQLGKDVVVGLPGTSPEPLGTTVLLCETHDVQTHPYTSQKFPKYEKKHQTSRLIMHIHLKE